MLQTRTRRAIFYSVCFIIGFIGISLFNFYTVTHPPQIEVDFMPEDFDLGAETIPIPTDGIFLSAWHIPSPQETKKAIVILHGYPVEKNDMLFFARELFPDFSLLLLDLRSFGESGGNYTTLGIKERNDVKRAIDFLESRGYERIGIFGFSLGGAIGFLTAAEDTRVHALASYASFSDLRSLGYDLYSRLLFFKKPMVELMLFWSRLFFGENLAEFSPVNAAKKLGIPVLIVHSTGDSQIPFEHGLRLKEALSQNTRAEFYELKGQLHGVLPRAFYGDLKDFFTRSL